MLISPLSGVRYDNRQAFRYGERRRCFVGYIAGMRGRTLGGDGVD